MRLSMLRPWGRETPGICGAFDLYCLPHPQEFDLESGSQGGDRTFAFFAWRNGAKSVAKTVQSLVVHFIKVPVDRKPSH